MNKVEQINSLQNFEDLIGFATTCFADKNRWVIPRINELLQRCDVVDFYMIFVEQSYKLNEK